MDEDWRTAEEDCGGRLDDSGEKLEDKEVDSGGKLKDRKKESGGRLRDREDDS